MTKTNTPLLSFDAKGSIGDAISFQKRDTGTLVRRKPTPTNPQTLEQFYHRWFYQDYAALWHTLTPAQQAAWTTLARPKRLTGFNYYMSVQLKTLPDLAGGWYLDHKHNNTAIDFSKNANTGTVIGAYPTEGLIDKAFYFDGLDDQITIPNSPSLQNITTGITVMMFIRLNSVASWKKFAVKGSSVCWEFWMGAQKQVRMGVYAGGLWNYISDGGAGTALVAETWYHAAMTYDQIKMRVYLNGILDRDQGKTGTLATTTSNVLIAPAGGAVRFAGRFDEIRIYNRPLSQTEILRHSLRRYPPL